VCGLVLPHSPAVAGNGWVIPAERSAAYSSFVRVDVLGPVAVVSAEGAVSGQGLGGRRARVALVALALSSQTVAADRLASMIWGEELPATWDVALRGVVRGLRAVLAPIGGGDQRVIATVPSGYRLAPDVAVDVATAHDALRSATELLSHGRNQAALDLADPVTGLVGEQLLPGDEATWLEPHRQAVDALALRALEIVVAAAGRLGNHHGAVAAARKAVSMSSLDERTHRSLIRALDESGDRAGAVQAYEQCRATLAEQLGIDPSAETVEVYLSAMRDQNATSSARLPVVTSSFVAREQEVATIDAALSRPGLVTIGGRGGVGKSRLAVRVASGRRDFGGGRLWVSLAPVAEDALVASTVALEVGVPLGTDDATAALAEHLAPLGRALLVLDGCEAVVDGVASLASALLATCPFLTLVVTSRVPLSLDGEKVITVEPLGEPAASDAAALLASPQVRLLLDRVHDSGGDFHVDDVAAPLLAELLHQCGGLPLALELVAAQLAAMPVGDLLDHLSDVLIDGEDRLRAVARGSYALLDDDEATVYRRFAVLDGPVGLPLIRQVVSGGPIAPVRVVRILRELTARGLLAVDRSGPRWRYHQDDDLHRFARELLIEHGDQSAAFGRLADAIRAALPDDARRPPAPFRDAITDMLGSIRSLFGATVDDPAHADRCLELAFRLHRYWAATNVAEGRYWLSRLLSDGPESSWTPYATYALGYLDYWSGDSENAIRELEAVVHMLEGVADPYTAHALIYLAGLLDDLDRGTEALEYVRRAIVEAQSFSIDLQVTAAMGMGSVLSERGAPEAATYAADAIALCRRGGSTEQLAAALPTAAMVCWQVGAIDEARSYLEEARPMHTGTRRIARVVMLSTAAGIALTEGDIEAAIDFGSAADQEATDLGVEREVPLIRSVLARALLARGDLASAVDRALAALDAANSMAFEYPVAICLETAALVVADADRSTDVSALLASAQVIRERGSRPPAATLAAEVERLRASLPLAEPLSSQLAAAHARAMLARLARLSTRHDDLRDSPSGQSIAGE
jgi:predicted ATPase/DNA-binding SARP family transcriptional activator